MSLTLSQEQQISSALHWWINQGNALHNDSKMNSINSIIAFVDKDIRNQSGTVYSTPSGIGALDNKGA